MNRAMIGAGIGTMFGVLALAAFGAWAGFTRGGEWVVRKDLQPGWEAACIGVLVFTAYFWWLTAGIGAVIGGLAGLGS